MIETVIQGDNLIITGMILLSSSFLINIAIIIHYLKHIYSDDNSAKVLANKLHKILFYILILIGVILFYAIWNHQFSIEYVAKYSSTKEEWYYLISTFWAGQEGTFYLWLLFTSIFGLFLIKKENPLTSRVMVILHLSIFFLILILLYVSPFRPLDPEILAELVDGKGLNPLLKNPWMVIHPPTLFLGYSSVIVPASYAIAALWARSYTDWLDEIFPWALFSAAILGIGVIMGGYWAYVVLGWGGYWAWDPVENASIFPWFTIVATFHGILIYKRSKALLKTTFILSIMSYFLMLYGSFLTRSGILGEFSVHSFSSLGINHYLIIFIVSFIGLAIYLFVTRLSDLKTPKKNLNGEKQSGLIKKLDDKFSKEMLLSFVVIIFILSTFVLFIGTSIPLFTLYAEQQSSSAQPEQYNLIFQYIGLIMFTLLALAPLTKWKKDELNINKSIFYLIAGIAFIITVITYVFFAGAKMIYYFMIFAGFWALLVNSYNLKRFSKSKYLRGSSITHIGLSMMFLGILASSTLGYDTRVDLYKGEVVTLNELELLYEKRTKDPSDENSTIYTISGKSFENSFKGELVFTYSDYNKGIMRKPFIQRDLMKDYYFSPVNQYEFYDTNKQLTLKTDTTYTILNNQIEFKGFNIIQMNPEADIFQVNANIEFETDGAERKVVKAYFEKARGTTSSEIYNLEEHKFAFKVLSVDATNKSIVVLYNDGSKPLVIEQLKIEVSQKPFIIVLWIGTIILAIGLLFTTKYRNKEENKLKGVIE